MDGRLSIRARLGISLIVLVTLASAFRQLRSTNPFRDLPQTDDISQYEQRFTEARQYLPPNQIVSYRDEFAPFSRQCNAFVLAQYSVAPTVLAVLDSPCGHMNGAGEVSSDQPAFLLENFHDLQSQPYLLRLFPSTYFHTQEDPAPVSSHTVRAAEMVLFHDFGLGVRLYTRGEK